MKSILTSARISGQRAYEPGLQKERPTGRQILGPGSWEAIITPDETERIRAVFARPDRRTSASSRTLLSSIATCSKCGAGLVSGSQTRQRADGRRVPKLSYVCKPHVAYPERGGLSVSRPGLDLLVGEVIIERLTHTTLPARAGGKDDADGVSAAMGRITAARQRLEDLARDYGAGVLSRAEFHAGRTAAQAAIGDGEQALGKVNRTSALKGVPVGDREALRAAWDVEWTIPQKRAILTALVDTLIVHPNRTAGHGSGPNASRSR